MKDKCKCHGWATGVRFSLFLSVLFAICFAWYWIRPVGQELHMQMLEISYFWFTGMNFWSFVAGFVQTFIWGWILIGLWHLVVGGCCSDDSCKK
mgnify:CR=1 FL=1|jgi:hypothetical protein